MTDTFWTTLANIKGQEPILNERDERAVETALGWPSAVAGAFSILVPLHNAQPAINVDAHLVAEVG